MRNLWTVLVIGAAFSAAPATIRAQATSTVEREGISRFTMHFNILTDATPKLDFEHATERCLSVS